MTATEFAILLAMALVTTYATWVLGRREWVRSLGLFYAVGGSVALWVQLATRNPENLWVLRASGARRARGRPSRSSPTGAGPA